MTTLRSMSLLALASLAACTRRAVPAATIARAAPTTPAPRDPLPEGYTLVRRLGYSIGVPTSWHPIPGPGHATASLVLGTGSDPQHGTFVTVSTLPFAGTLDGFVDESASVLASDHLVVATRTASRAGSDAAVDLELVRRDERTTHMRMLVAESHRVGITLGCGDDAPASDAMRAACAAVFDSLQFGDGRAPAPGLRAIAGDGWSLAVPTSWSEREPDGATRLFAPPGDHAGMALHVTSPLPPVPFTATVLARYQREPDAQVTDRRETLHRPDDRRTVFERTTHVSRVDLDEVSRALLHGGVVVYATCVRGEAFTIDERAQCARVLDTLRGE